MFEQFKNRVEIINLENANQALTLRIIDIRKSSGLKLPDAIVAACAIESNATLISNDAVFQRLEILSLKTF